MSREVRIFAEGSLRWVQASGTGGWNTASAPISALVGFVQAGLGNTSAQTVVTVMERGSAHHHKVTEKPAGEVTFTYLQAVTANMANPAQSSGVSNPQVHFELKHSDVETPTLTGQYFQFHNCVLVSRAVTEGAEGNQIAETWRWLSMVGPTGSGWLG